jgi:transposase
MASLPTTSSTQIEVSPTTVRLWIARFEESGPEALLHDAPGRGRHPAIAPEAMRERLREANLVTADGLPFSIRQAARFLGVSATAVWRALKKTRHSA